MKRKRQSERRQFKRGHLIAKKFEDLNIIQILEVTRRGKLVIKRIINTK